jgi:uncharacterized protein
MKTLSTSLLPSPTPWYREPWPWLLMSGPAIVVVAGIFTAYLAVRSHDGLVVDDYYKQGLAVNKDLSRDIAAKTAGYSAVAIIDASKGRVTLTLQHSPASFKDLTLTLSRATASGRDQRISLQRANQRNGENTFIGALKSLEPLESGKWYVTLDDPSRSWRLLTSITIQGAAPITFSLGDAEANAEANTLMKPADD